MIYRFFLLKIIAPILLIHLGVTTIYGQLLVQPFDSKINTSNFEEIGPVLSEDGKTLYFTRVGSPDFVKQYTDGSSHIGKSLRSIFSQISGKSSQDISSSPFNQDIWVATIDSEMNIIDVEHPGYPLNNAFPNSVCSVFSKENSLIVINQFDNHGGIYEGFSKIKLLDNGNYGPPQPIDIKNYFDEGDNVNLTMSKDGQQIFISMKRHDGFGENDLYVSIKLGNNLWTEPKLLSSSINTRFNETSPFLSADKKTLIFSSNKPGGQGGQDLYMSRRLDYSYRNWSKPVPLDPPINSPAHDFFACLSDNGRYIIFNSTRNGSSDIFYVDFNRSEVLKENVEIHLKVVDAESNLPTRAKIYHGYSTSKQKDFFNSYSGYFSVNIEKNYPYLFEVKKRGYDDEQIILHPIEAVNKGKLVDTLVVKLYRKDLPKSAETVAKEEPQKNQKSTVVQKIKDKPIPEGKYPFEFDENKKVTLSEIHFKQGTPYVLTKSMPTIEKMVKMLKDNPTMEILIVGHTDNVGDKAALKSLSEERALAIKKHCMFYNVESSRIKTIGKGDTEPLNANQTEKEKAQNRRVEIVILTE